MIHRNGYGYFEIYSFEHMRFVLDVELPYDGMRREEKKVVNWLRPFFIRAEERVPMEPLKRVVMMSTNRYIFA